MKRDAMNGNRGRKERDRVRRHGGWESKLTGATVARFFSRGSLLLGDSFLRPGDETVCGAGLIPSDSGVPTSVFGSVVQQRRGSGLGIDSHFHDPIVNKK